MKAIASTARQMINAIKCLYEAYKQMITLKG